MPYEFLTYSFYKDEIMKYPVWKNVVWLIKTFFNSKINDFSFAILHPGLKIFDIPYLLLTS